jgi:alpha-mannosidase
VRIIEEGPVRRIIEAVLAWGSSRVIQRYILYRDLPYLDVVHRVFWGEKDRMLKIEVPLAFSPQRLVVESLFGAATRVPEAAHMDQTCQRWLAVLAGDRCLAVLNDGSFGCSLSGRRLYLNVLRSCAYACANLQAGDERHERRYIPRQGQGEQQVTFRLLPGRRFDESAVRRQADILNVPPVWQVYHPSPDGAEGRPQVPARGEAAPAGVPLLEVRPAGVHLVALKRSERGDSLIVRLLETRGRKSRYEVRLAGEAGPVTGRLEPWSLKTLEIGRRSDGRLTVTEVNLVEENLAGPR